MTDTREQIAARAVAEVSWTMDSHGFRIAAAHAAAGVSAGAKAVTDRVREGANLQALSCHASPLEYGPERPWLDLLALLDQIDAELGGE